MAQIRLKRVQKAKIFLAPPLAAKNTFFHPLGGLNSLHCSLAMRVLYPRVARTGARGAGACCAGGHGDCAVSGSCFGSDEVTSATEAAAEAEKDSRLPDLMCWGTEVGFFLGRGMLTPCERGIAHLRYTPHTGRARAMSTITATQCRRIFRTAGRRKKLHTSCKISSTRYRKVSSSSREDAFRRTPGERAFTRSVGSPATPCTWRQSHGQEYRRQQKNGR